MFPSKILVFIWIFKFIWNILKITYSRLNILTTRVNEIEKKLDKILTQLNKSLNKSETNSYELTHVQPLGNKLKASDVNLREKSFEFQRALASNSPRLSPYQDKSQPSFYPDSRVLRVIVPENRRSWEASFPNYTPTNYTSKDVLANTNADSDLINRPLNLRQPLGFNRFDEVSKIDRRSCFGEYKAVNYLPLNPAGRIGIEGRGSLLYWGPNNIIECIFTR